MQTLVEKLNDHRRIAIAGICKNAGKTTVLNHLVEAFHQSHQLGITSIGYDGEEKDGVTGLKKPRVKVHDGMIVVTTEACLQRTHIDYDVIRDTTLGTALGRVVFIRVKSTGIIEISGPSMVSRMRTVCDEMAALGCDKILIDGAVGRITHGAYTDSDAMVLSVGGALSNDMEKVIKETEHLVEVMALPQIESPELSTAMGHADPYTALGYDAKDMSYTAYDSQRHDEVTCIFRGAVADRDIMAIIADYRGIKKRVVVKNATSVFLSPRVLHRFRHELGEVNVLHGINLVAVTINPTSPYGRGFDAYTFQMAMERAIDLPVYNVMREGMS